MKKALYISLVTFTIGLLVSCTKDNGPDNPQQSLPAGALSGEFSVSDAKKVHFSQGNLWYGKVGTATTATWNFETNQYDSTPIGDGDRDSNHISHFFWSKNESVAYAESYNDPEATESDIFFTNATETTAKTNFTVNGVTGKYRTLSKDEWQYLLETRSVGGGTGENHSYSHNITYGGRKGLVLYPDNYSGKPISGTVSALPEGVVFLLAAGSNFESIMFDVDEEGYYWSSSAANTDDDGFYFAYDVYFQCEDGYVFGGCYPRKYAYSVRLVTE